MEDILYRGKRKSDGEWVQGWYVMYSKSIEHLYSRTNGKHCIVTAPHNFNYEIDPLTVCQYTGCLTADIKKIFANDIVEIDGAIGVVKFGKYGNGFHLGFYIEWINSEYRQELGFWDGKVKYLGNVFDNPELIKCRRTDI